MSDEPDTQTLEMITSLAGFISLDDILQNLKRSEGFELSYTYFILLEVIKNCLVFRHDSTELHKLLYWKTLIKAV